MEVSIKRGVSDTMHLPRAFVTGMNDVEENQIHTIHVINQHIEYCTGYFACKKTAAPVSMMMICVKSYLFGDSFWIGLYERENEGRYEVCKIIFGAESKDYEVYDFSLTNWHKLRVSLSLETTSLEERHINPKRMHRQIRKQMQEIGIGIKAQQALKLMREESKAVRKIKSHEQREAEKEQQFSLRQKKRKEKYEGH